MCDLPLADHPACCLPGGWVSACVLRDVPGQPTGPQADQTHYMPAVSSTGSSSTASQAAASSSGKQGEKGYDYILHGHRHTAVLRCPPWAEWMMRTDDKRFLLRTHELNASEIGIHFA